MNVEEAEAVIALDKIEKAWVKAKQSGKKDPAYFKARDALIEARNDYRINLRTAPSGPGDATVTYESGV